ncbi:hypothetical protein QTO34_007848 [Cnephaeus nilssonii]|uniref:Protein FAM170A n=1 Tax=Cnephaeus nilssonii TaxID=3371016 RepID=A0AA40LH78_CNENI|nr:hypothetical protein QTO34_007848 [Eptesicus nilssonii]
MLDAAEPKATAWGQAPTLKKAEGGGHSQGLGPWCRHKTGAGSQDHATPKTMHLNPSHLRRPHPLVSQQEKSLPSQNLSSVFSHHLSIPVLMRVDAASAKTTCLSLSRPWRPQPVVRQQEKSLPSQNIYRCLHPIQASRLDEDEMKELPVSRHSEQTEDSSDYLHSYIPSHSLNKKEPFQSPAHGTDVRPMKMYYMRVQLKRGVAVLFHTKEGLVPPSKKIKMEEMTYLGKVHKDVPFSHMSEKKHLIAREPMLDSRAQEKRGEADRPAHPPAVGGYPSAKTPEWLVALDSGFRCMACCRVFPSLQVLQEHVECGVREGFSCHVFHRAMAHLKYKERMRKKKEKKKKATFRF